MLELFELISAHETSFGRRLKLAFNILPQGRYLVLFNKVTAAVYDNLTHVGAEIIIL